MKHISKQTVRAHDPRNFIGQKFLRQGVIFRRNRRPIWQHNSTDPYNKLGKHVIFDPRRTKQIVTCYGQFLPFRASRDFIRIV